MRFYEFVSHGDINHVRKISNQLWHQLGIDLKFSQHFFDRVNDKRNGEDITTDELVDLFKKEYQKYGKTIANMDINSHAVLTDLLSKVNIPVTIKPGQNNKQLMAKTVMRKQNFKAYEPILKV